MRGATLVFARARAGATPRSEFSAGNVGMSHACRRTHPRARRPVALRSCLQVILVIIAAGRGTGTAAEGTDPATGVGHEIGSSAMTHVRILADDAMEGRGLGHPGMARALCYAESVMAAVGLEPAFVDGDGRRTFRQEVPVVRYRLGGRTRGTLDRGDERRELTSPQDMLVFRPGHAGTPVSGGVAYVGYGIREPELGRDDYDGIDARGKWVVLREGRPEHLSPELEVIYGNVDRSGDRILDAALRAGAIGLIIVPSLEVYDAWDIVGESFSEAVYAAAQRYLGGAQADCEVPVVVLSEDQMQFLFAGSGLDPLAESETAASFVVEHVRLHVTIDSERDIVTSANLGGFVRGTERPEEYVTLSAHLDHLGVMNGETHNGANDDASGCAVVLAAAPRLVPSPPSRSILFVLFTGEEVGHFGSLHFLTAPPAGRLVAGLNLEHVGRSSDGELLTVAPPGLLPGLDEIAHELGGMHTATLDADGQTIRGSDGYSYYLHGIAIVTMGGGMFPEYHTPGDDAELVDKALLEKSLDLSIAVVRQLAGTQVIGEPDR